MRCSWLDARWWTWLLAGALATTARAQDPGLAPRVHVAALAADPRALRELCPGPQLGDVIDALLADRTLADWARSRALADLFASRREAIEALWQSAPSKRCARAELFGRLDPPFLLARHRCGERADTECAAWFAAPAECWDEAMRRVDDEPLRSSAAALQRSAARGAIARPDAAIERLRLVRGTAEEMAMVSLSGTGTHGVCPFAIAGLLTDPDPVVRVRAMVVLRQSLGLPVLDWLAKALDDDPAPGVRPRAAPTPVCDAMLGPLLAAIARGDPRAWRRNVDATHLSPAGRRRLARAWVTAALHAPTDQLGDSEAGRLFVLAAQADPDDIAALLAVAASTPDPRIARRAIGAVVLAMSLEDLGTRAATAMAPLLCALLDHADDAVRTDALRIARTVLDAHPACELRERLATLARAAMTPDGRTVDVELRASDLDDSRQPGSPRTFAAGLVFVAAVAGDARLFPPLLAELQRLQADGDLDSAHREFVLQCLAALAPRLDAAAARKLHATLAPEYLAAAAAAEEAGSFTKVVESTLAIALCRLFWSVPDDLLCWYDRLLAPEHEALRVAPSLGEMAVDASLPEARLVRVLSPERLTADWRAGPPLQPDAIRQLARYWPAQRQQILDWQRRGRLPRGLVAAVASTAACDAVPGPAGPVRLDLGTLAELLPESTDDAHAWEGIYCHAIACAAAADPARDVAALRTLAAAAQPPVAMCAAGRALSFGQAGRAIAVDAIARLVAVAEIDVVKAATDLAIENGIAVDALHTAVARLRACGSGDSWAQVLADAVELRFFGLDPLATRSGRPVEAIACAGIEVDLETLRRVVDGRGRSELPQLTPACSATTHVRALRLAAEIEPWSRPLESLVVAATTHDDPRVRRAAYLALKTRDRELWPCAWLVCETELDPDATVRAVGR
jgi:hypothetical protein